jgi:hypothetical protein
MNSDPDKYWKSIVGKLRRAQGMSPPTPEEAEAAFDAAPDMPFTPEEVQRMTEAAKSGGPIEFGAEELWDESAYKNLPEESLQVFRNEGDTDDDADRRERELEDKLLNEDDSEDGMEEDSEPPERSR